MEIQDEKPVEDRDTESAHSEQNVDHTGQEPSEKHTRPVEDNSKDAENPEDEHQHIAGVKLWTLMGSLTLVTFLMMLDMSIIVTAIPRITSDFHSLSDVGWYGSAFLISSCALQPLTGKFYTHVNAKYTFIFFLGVFELGSALCGAAQSSKMLIIGRAVAGMGSSGLSNGAMTILSNAAPLHKRPALFGILMSFSQIGIVGGPLIGGALTQYATWRWCFYVNLPIGGLAAIILLLINIPTRHSKSADGMVASHSRFGILSRLDLLGFVLFAGFAVMFLLALEWGGTTYAWRSSVIIGLFCGAGATLLVFAAWELHMGNDAMIPPSMVRRRIVICSCFTIFFFFGSMLLFSYYLPIYFQAVRGVSPALSGVYVLPQILSQMVLATVSGLLVGRWGYYLPWSVASAAIVCVSAGLISTFTPHTPTVAWVFYQIIGGIGRGCGIQMPILAIQNDVPPAQNSVGMALVIFFQTFGGSLFLTFAQTIFDQRLVDDLREYAPTVDPQTVVKAGATAIRQVVTPEQLGGVLEAYNKAVNDNFYLAAGASAATFCLAWGIGWRKISKKKVGRPEA